EPGRIDEPKILRAHPRHLLRKLALVDQPDRLGIGADQGCWQEHRGDLSCPQIARGTRGEGVALITSFDRASAIPRSYPCAQRPHTSPATSAIIRNFAHCSSSARILPSSVEAKPHCGDRQNWSSGANLPASSMRRLTSSFFSSVPLLEVTRPSTTTLLPF